MSKLLIISLLLLYLHPIHTYFYPQQLKKPDPIVILTGGASWNASGSIAFMIRILGAW